MSLLVSTPSSVGILKLGQSSKSAAFTPLVLPARLQRSAEVEIETSWSCDGRHVQVLPSAGVKPGDTVFSYSCKGRRMQDLVAPGKRRVEKVQCIGTSDGRRELVVVDDGEVRVMQVLVDEKGAETSPKVVASYEVGTLRIRLELRDPRADAPPCSGRPREMHRYDVDGDRGRQRRVCCRLRERSSRGMSERLRRRPQCHARSLAVDRRGALSRHTTTGASR